MDGYRFLSFFAGLGNIYKKRIRLLLAMNSKEWHRDRIEELKIKQLRILNLRSGILQALIGVSSFIIVVIGFYLPNFQRDISQLFFTVLILGLAFIGCGIIDHKLSKDEEKIAVQLKRNFDVLLGRETHK